MNLLTPLLALYAGVLLVHVALSAVLWRQQKTKLHKSLFFVWLSVAVAFLFQGALAKSELGIILSFSFASLIDFALAALFAQLTSLKLPWRWYFLIQPITMLMALILKLNGAAFWLASLPVSIGVAWPLADTAIRVIRFRWNQLTTSAKALVVVCFINCANILDFPFLRNQEQLAVLGFTIALLIVFAYSITAPAAVLEKVAEERLEALETNQVQKRFFANVSHELRTPLTLILASLQDLLDRRGDEDEQKELELAQRNASTLLRLIDEILDLAKADAGGLRLHVHPVDLKGLVASITEINQPLARHKSIELRAVTMSAENVYGDAYRLESVLGNLIGNALKYTPAGGRIEVSMEDQADCVVVSVRDNGPGISAEELPRVFDRFYQTQSAVQKRAGGVGIGLSLAKEIMEIHGGKISVGNEPTGGAVFTIMLKKGMQHFRPEILERRSRVEPQQNRGRRQDDKSAPVASGDFPKIPRPLRRETVEPIVFVGGRKPRVLLAEDQEELRTYIQGLLAQEFDVILSYDGAHAWELVQKESFDLLVSDVMMPHKTGTELCQAIKTHPQLRKLPVILLTARVGSEAAIDAYAHGADDFVPKPFHPKVLMARVRAQLRIRSLALQVVNQEKLAAVGTLAAGIAHEVKNPVNAVINAARVMLANSSMDRNMQEKLLKIIENGAKRIEDISSALESHARPAEGTALAEWDVREGLEATLLLIEHRMDGTKVKKRFATNRLAQTAPSPINQVFLNLVDNAVRSGAKSLDIDLDESADRLFVKFRDDGPGIPRDIAERIFDPFFTTREPGHGTGLGLYLSRKLVEDQGGELTLQNAGQPGAEFLVTLPAAKTSH